MTNKTDLLEHLELFERTATRKETPKEDWSDMVIPILNDKFRSTAVMLPAEVREDYDALKTALLERDEVNIKKAAATFWTYTKQAGVSALEHRQFVQRLVKRFIDGDDKDSYEDALVREKTIQDLPKDGRTYVCERKPKTSLDVARLAEEYFAIREESTRHG